MTPPSPRAMQATVPGSAPRRVPAPPPPRPVHHRRTECRACGGRALRRVLRLGPQPLANAFLRDAESFGAEMRFPLDLHVCETCSLVQLVDVIDPEVLFRDYVYVTGTSTTIAEHNRRYADAVVRELGMGPDDLVVEAASNDGSLLREFARRGVRALGVEPARNIAEMARAAGIETVAEFFEPGIAARLREEHGPARAVIGNNVLAHVDDTRGFLRAGRDLLAPGGRVVVEVPCGGELLERLEYDTVYHEHLCYFSVAALLRLAEGAGLAVRRVDRVPVHGGSLRVWMGIDSESDGHDAAVLAMAEEERARGVASPERWERFARDVDTNRTALRALLGRLRMEGRSVAGYGAPAKGNTLLNYCGIGADLLPYTVDRSPLKVGSWTPGMHIPVLPVETLLERQPDYVLILAWNFADEIMEQQSEYRARGGRFVLPVPEPRIV